MEDVLSIANGPVMWLFSTCIVAVVVVQACLYLRMTLAFSDRYEILTPDERTTVYKTAAINSIGPAIAIFFVAVSLIAMVGGPVTLMRVGVIGSAVFEFVAADSGAKAVGAQLGTDSYTLQAFTTSVWVMTLGGMGWLLSTFFLTKNLGKAQDRLNATNPALIKAMATVTPVAIFATLIANTAVDKQWLSNVTIANDDLSAIAAGAVAMVALNVLGARWAWLREWSVGLSLVAGMTAGYFAGIATA